jgi:hypothetical protein
MSDDHLGAEQAPDMGDGYELPRVTIGNVAHRAIERTNPDQTGNDAGANREQQHNY